MSCTKTERVHRFHDGELSPSEREGAAAHIGACAECRETLAALRRLSQLLAEAPRADLSAEAAQRVRESWYTVRDRGVVRAAGWLTAAAAAVLVAALLTGPGNSAEAGSRLPIWQTVAVTEPVGVQDAAPPDTVVTAQWMADDLLADGRQ